MSSYRWASNGYCYMKTVDLQNFANAFVNRVISVCAAYDRVDVQFDRYGDNASKASTRQM